MEALGADPKFLEMFEMAKKIEQDPLGELKKQNKSISVSNMAKIETAIALKEDPL